MATVREETQMGSCNGNGAAGLIEAPRSGHAGLLVTRLEESCREAKRQHFSVEKEA